VRRALVPVLAVGALLVSAAPAAQPDYPVTFISVTELKTALDGGTKADIIDVRNWDAYVDMHIKGARSMPLRSVPDRSGEIKKSGLVVFY
jgi:3-mercaptopyruvate sulfurtransferase SseA